MSNPGAIPVDPTSLVGQVRGLVGDTQHVPLEPAVTGQGSYDRFSDAEILAFLALGNGSVLRATGFAVQQMSTAAALEAMQASTDDLKYACEKRAGDLLASAKTYFAQADAADATVSEADSIFGIYDPWAPHAYTAPEQTTSLHADPANPGYYIP